MNNLSKSPSDRPDKQDFEGRWLEVRHCLPLSGQARRLSRGLRRAGALKVWRDGDLVRSLWPDEPQSRRALDRLAGEGNLRPPEITPFRGDNPLAAWLAPRPRAAAPGLDLAPAWMGLEPGPGTLVIDALTAFGAGDHPSTQLNLELLARVLERRRPPAGAWLADVGAGAGVLALGMALRGRRPVAAVDPEPASRRAVARNRRLNPLAGPLVHFILGTHRALRGPFYLTASNLPGPILLEAGRDLVAMTSPGGRLVVSGFRDEAASEVGGAFAALGMTAAQSLSRDGWTALELARPEGG